MASNRTEAFKLYQTVIEDTISNVREAFLDERIDEQVLIELKQIWEQRLEQSRAVDTGEPPQTHHVQSYHDIQAAQAAQRQQAKQERAAARPTSSNAKSQKKQAAQQQQQATSGKITFKTPQAAAATLALPQGVLQLQPHQLAQLQGVTTLPAGVTVSGQQFPAHQVQGGSGFQIVQQPVSVPEGQLQPGQVIQFTTQAGQTATVQGNVLQVDGGNDTSDEEDEYDNEDDDADDKDDGPNDVEEEPLNTDDDVSDEDAAELFETDNVVVCQYDRLQINRNRNKWKFTLKSGIMNLKGKDHVFFKATGDAEW